MIHKIAAFTDMPFKIIHIFYHHKEGGPYVNTTMGECGRYLNMTGVWQMFCVV